MKLITTLLLALSLAACAELDDADCELTSEEWHASHIDTEWEGTFQNGENGDSGPVAVTVRPTSLSFRTIVEPGGDETSTTTWVQFAGVNCDGDLVDDDGVVVGIFSPARVRDDGPSTPDSYTVFDDRVQFTFNAISDTTFVDSTCDDGTQNGSETNVDCGGDICDGCGYYSGEYEGALTPDASEWSGPSDHHSMIIDIVHRIIPVSDCEYCDVAICNSETEDIADGCEVFEGTVVFGSSPYVQGTPCFGTIEFEGTSSTFMIDGQIDGTSGFTAQIYPGPQTWMSLEGDFSTDTDTGDQVFLASYFLDEWGISCTGGSGSVQASRQ